MQPYVRQLAVGPMQNFVYLVGPADSQDTAVIDAAWDVPALFAAADQDGRRITHALATHRHHDHTNGLEALLQRAAVSIAIHPDEIPHITAEVPASAYLPVADGSVIQVGSLPIRCLHTPGHTPGSICFHVGGEGEALFTGDTLFVNHCGRCDFTGGDPRQMFESLHRILDSFPDQTIIYPGHDYGDVRVSSVGRERTQNPYMRLETVDEFVAFRMGPRR